jgi:hypothetical protein
MEEAKTTKIPEFIKAIGTVVVTYAAVFIVVLLVNSAAGLLLRLTAASNAYAQSQALNMLDSIATLSACLGGLAAAGYSLNYLRHYKLFSRVCGGVLIGGLTPFIIPHAGVNADRPLWGYVLLGAGIAALSGLSRSKTKQTEAVPAPVPTKTVDPTPPT